MKEEGSGEGTGGAVAFVCSAALLNTTIKHIRVFISIRHILSQNTTVAFYSEESPIFILWLEFIAKTEKKESTVKKTQENLYIKKKNCHFINRLKILECYIHIWYAIEIDYNSNLRSLY